MSPLPELLPLAGSEFEDGIEILIHVQPRAAKNSVGGLHDGALRVRVTAAAHAGAANAAICRVLGAALDVRPSAVQIRRGQRSRRKRLRIVGEPILLWARVAVLSRAEHPV